MRKEVEVFEIPTNNEDLEEYFYEVNYTDNKDGDTIIRKDSRELSKRFIAAVEILNHLFKNPGRNFSRSQFIEAIAGDDLAYKDNDQTKLSTDAFKYGLKILKDALIITNIHNEKNTTEYGVSPHLDVYIPKGNHGKRSKAHMIVSTIYNEMSLGTYNIAKTILASNIYELIMPTFYGYDLKEKDEIPICDPEKIPYWKEEMELVKQGGYSSQEEFNEIMYQKTGEDRYLPQSTKDLFVF